VKVYSYTDADLGIDAIPPGTLRFDTFQKVDRPDDADVILVPPTLQAMKRLNIDPNRLIHLRCGIHKHVFFDISDDFRTFPALKDAIFLRASLTKHMQAVNPRSLALPWPVQGSKFKAEFSPMGERPRKLVSFVGWSSSGITRAAIDSVVQVFTNHPLDFHANQHHVACYSPEEQTRMFAAHRQSMRDCMIVLCPASITNTEGYALGADKGTLERDYQGIPVGTTPASNGYIYPGGNLRYRMFEAMAEGRVPVVICTGHVLPRPDRIPWDQVAYFIEENDVENTGARILKIIRRDSQVLHDKGMLARKLFFEHLDSDQWERIFREMVEEEVARWRPS